MKPTVYIVILRVAYEGDTVEAVFMDQGKAKAYRDERISKNRWSHHDFRVEEWEDGATNGTEIE